MAVTRNDRVIIMTAAADAVTDTVLVEKFRWVGPTTLAHTVVVQDTASREHWSAACGTTSVGDESTFENRPIQMVGVKASTMGSGKLYIYLA